MTQENPTSFRQLLSGCWEATQGERGRFFAFVVIFVLAYCVDLATPFVIGWTLGVFMEQGVGPEAFQKGMWGVAAFTGVRLTYALLHHAGRYIQIQVAYSSRMHALNKLFGSLMGFPLRWHVQHHSGESLSKLHRSVGAVEGIIGNYVWQIIEGVVKIIMVAVTIFALDYWVAINVIGWSLVTIGAMLGFNQKLTQNIRANNRFYNKLNRLLVDYMANVVTVKTLALEPAAKRHLAAQRQEGLGIARRLAMLGELKWGAVDVGYAIVTGSSLLLYFYSHPNMGTATEVAKVYVLIDYVNRVCAVIGSFTGYYQALIEASTAYEDATGIYSLETKYPARADAGSYKRSWNHVTLKNVNFSYVRGEKFGLDNVEFEFKRGEKVALVGHSGSGKSTLLKVLAGLIDPESYSLSTDLQASVDLETFAGSTLLIPQEPEIFSESFLYNLTMGEEFDPKEISFFISLCKLDILLGKLPKGWDTDLAEKGLNLSVGEKQRLALARGLLRASKRDVLLLDEPTSSLDPKTEKEIYLGLLYHFADRCVFSSCHRLNLIPLFDRIVYMSHSSVLEVGSFSQLLEKRGHFYKIWDDYERNIKNVSGKSTTEGDDSSDLSTSQIVTASR